MKNSLEGKKILFISPKFFSYEKEIKLALEKEGAQVTYYDERPGNGFWVKALIRINNFFLAPLINRYYKRILTTHSDIRFDYIFIIKGESINEQILKKFREQYKTAVFILYLWDSVANIKNAKRIFRFFDSIFTFDINDTKKYESFKFRSLFFIESVNTESEKIKKQYDLCFIGTMHSDRYEIIRKIRNRAGELNLKCFFYLYFPNRILFFINKLFHWQYRNSTRYEFQFLPLSIANTIRVLKDSTVILDIQHPDQTGLTLRTMESLGFCRKLITTNKHITDYDFFNSDNIKIIDRKNPVIDPAFFVTDYYPIDEKVYAYYSIKMWIRDIFNSVS